MMRASVLAAGLVLALGGCAAGSEPMEGSGTVLPPPATTPTTTIPGGTSPTTPTTAPPPPGTGSGSTTTTPPASGGTGGTGTIPPTTSPPPTTLPPTAGSSAPPPAAGAGGATATPPMLGSMMPTVPALTADCPQFAGGSISFMGLSGITVDGGAAPASPTAPMVFYWHGTGSFAGEYAGMAAAVAQGVAAEGGVLISFQGTTGGDLLSGTAIFGAGDFDLADQLLACAVQNHNVDPHRVFATGCSAGGLFSGAMAAERSSYIAAAAPNSGGWTVPLQFENDHTPALMTIHGAPGVDVVIIDFSQSSATADMAFKARGGFVINCNHGGGHCGGGGLAPDIWEFFKAHPYGVDPEPWTSLPAGFNSACEIF